MNASELDQFKLNNRRALVTGGAKGLGKVIAGALAQAGADVAVSARTLSDCEAAAAEIRTIRKEDAGVMAADLFSFTLMM